MAEAVRSRTSDDTAGAPLVLDASPVTIRWSRVVSAVLVLVCLSSAPYVQLSIRVANDGLSPGGWPYLYTYFGAALLSVGLFALDVVPTIDSFRRFVALVPVLAFASLAVASAGWTASPEHTPTQAVLLSALLLFAVWFGRALRRREQAISLVVVTQALTLGSWVAVILIPNSTVYLDGWTGVFASGNTLGPVAGLGAIVLGACLLAVRPGPRHLAAGLILMLADAYVAYRSLSDTAVLAFGSAVVVAVAVVPLTSRWRRSGASPRWLIVILAVTGVAAWRLLFVVIGPVTRAVGKDPTLSDRRLIWAYLRSDVVDRRMFGFGFGSFWNDPAYVYPLYEITGSVYGSAHSSFMEAWVGLGYVGAVLLGVVCVQAIVGVGRVVWFDHQKFASVGVLMVFVFVLIENTTESMITLHSFFWTLMISAAFIQPAHRPENASENRPENPLENQDGNSVATEADESSR